METAQKIAQLAPMPSGPLAGTLVLELCGDEPSGTLGTQILGDLGATVIKIERFGADAGQLLQDQDRGAVALDVNRVRHLLPAVEGGGEVETCIGFPAGHAGLYSNWAHFSTINTRNTVLTGDSRKAGK